MNAKQLSELLPQLGTEEEIAEIFKQQDSIPKLNFHGKKITCATSVFGHDLPQGHIFIQSLSDKDIPQDPIGAIDLDPESCDALLKALASVKKQFRELAKIRKNRRK